MKKNKITGDDKMKLDIQLFGGRGASSSIGAGGNAGSKMSFGKIKAGNTFDITEKSGETIRMKVGRYDKRYGYYVEGRAKNGGRISFLTSDSQYNKLSGTSKLYAIPFSKTSNWKQ